MNKTSKARENLIKTTKKDFINQNCNQWNMVFNHNIITKRKHNRKA